MTRVFIDGSAGTTGLRIRQRLSERRDIELMTLSEELRKDTEARREALNTADVAFLCLPDAAAREAVTLVTDANVRVIDTSTAHRVAEGWVYGFAELGLRDAIAASHRIANPGCHATGFISLAAPLVKTGLLKPDAALTAFSLTGYSGGGKSMIAEYEAEGRDIALDAPGIYGLNQQHKHLPEMQKLCGLDKPPVFCPIVDDYLCGMAVTLPLHSELLGGAGIERVREVLSDFYSGQSLVRVLPYTGGGARLHANRLSGTDVLEIIIAGNDERVTLTAVFDNLGKGASGAAIENMNIALGLPPETGLVTEPHGV